MVKFGLRGYDTNGRLDAPDLPAPVRTRGLRTQHMTNDSDPKVSGTPSPPPYRRVDNWTSLSGIRRALGPDLLSRLPTLAQLRSRPVGRVRPFDSCPLAIEIGSLLTPDKRSPNYLIPIFASIGTRGQAPLCIFTPNKDLTDIVAREFGAVESVDSTNFFQDWEVFKQNVHVLWAFLIPHCWDDLKALVTYCLLLAWEMEQPVVWDPIPTRIDMAEILEDLCLLKPKPSVRDTNDDESSDDESNSDDEGDEAPPPDATPVDRQQGTVTGANGNTTDGTYSLPLEATDHLSKRPSARMLAAINRRIPDSMSYGARKRQALQCEIKETVEEPPATQLLDAQQDIAPMNTTQTQGTEHDLDVVKKVQSFKSQYRRPGSRAPTPSQPSYELISPPLPSTSAMLVPPVPIHRAAAQSPVEADSVSGAATPPRAIQIAKAKLPVQSSSELSGLATLLSSQTDDRSTSRQYGGPVASEAKIKAVESATEMIIAHSDVQSAEDAPTVHDGSLNSRKRKVVDEEAGDEAIAPSAEGAKGETSTTQSARPRRVLTFGEYMAHKKAKLNSEMPESTDEVNETKAEVDES